MKFRIFRCGILVFVLAGAAMHAPASAALPQESIAALQRMMAAGELSSEQLTTQALNAAVKGQALNAFISVDREGALNQARTRDEQRRRGDARGPLHGIPIAVKDNIHVAGLPNTAGTPLLKSFVPRADAPVVERLKAAGAVVLGKTNLHELAFRRHQQECGLRRRGQCLRLPLHRRRQQRRHGSGGGGGHGRGRPGHRHRRQQPHSPRR